MKDGQPCSHPGCASHVTHPCECCGRAQGRTVAQKLFDLRMLVKQMRRHQNDGPNMEEPFSVWSDKMKAFKKLIDEELSK